MRQWGGASGSARLNFRWPVVRRILNEIVDGRENGQCWRLTAEHYCSTPYGRPSGYSLDRAVATTFTLDLETALTVPLAFAGFRLEEQPDPIEVMQSLRGMSERIDVFCQAGAIGAGRWPSDLLALLEDVVHPVQRPQARPHLPSEDLGTSIPRRSGGACISAAGALPESHRRPQLGHDPLARWLAGEDGSTSEMRRWFGLFGRCPGWP